MQAYQLEFFTEHDKRHGHQALYQWLLDTARGLGIRGATVFTGTMGFGRHGRMHSAHFFELADQPVVVTMAATEEEAQHLFARLEQEQVHLVYVKIPVEYGETGHS